MKPFLAPLAFAILLTATMTRAQQSPLAPPVVPKPSDAAKSATLKLGDRAPDFALPNGDGKLVILSEYTQRSPVVLVFYRGYWCSACTQQLTKLAGDYNNFKRAGGEVIAISADQQSFAWSMGQTTGAKFEILSDADKKVITSYGILNAAEHGGIAHPAIFIVDREGKIRFLHVGKDPMDRPADETIIEALKKAAEAK